MQPKHPSATTSTSRRPAGEDRRSCKTSGQLAHFNRKVIPERCMHAKAPARSARSPSRTTSAATPRPGSSRRGQADPDVRPILDRRQRARRGRRRARDIRGFALKFYTEEGNWDMVGNDTPVFFFRDPPPWHLFVVGRLFNRKPARKCSFENADNGSFSLCLNILINALGADVWCSRPSSIGLKSGLPHFVTARVEFETASFYRRSPIRFHERSLAISEAD